MRTAGSRDLAGDRDLATVRHGPCDTRPKEQGGGTCQAGVLQFPLLGQMAIGNPHNYSDATAQANLARNDLAILGMYAGWGSGDGYANTNKTLRISAISGIKAINPKILLGN